MRQQILLVRSSGSLRAKKNLMRVLLLGVMERRATEDVNEATNFIGQEVRVTQG